jgi:hypothetical protein
MAPEKLLKRYRDGYLASNWIGRIGTAVKTIGAILAVLVWFITVIVGKKIMANQTVELWLRDGLQLSAGKQDDILFYTSLVLALVIYGVLALMGTLISAMGQVVRAVLDTAVNTSPFLSTEEKGDVMQTSWWKEWKKEQRKFWTEW